jgi:hypothetical protein
MPMEIWGQERVKKFRFAISAESALKYFSFGRRTNDVCNARIHFGSPRKSQESISSHVPDGKFSHISLRTNQELQETFRPSPSFRLKRRDTITP